nr:protein UPSTREAM OF FLC [Ipomoea batatas]
MPVSAVARPFCRRFMEPHHHHTAAAAAAAAEVRKLHIVYFLSRNGRIEHPHLIRVHHLSRHGVRLRDVKRWMGELRGKELPESYAWSYKRKYKTGYVWQDLVDDDLLTPISDNEYVLKGSEISSSTPTKEHCYREKVVPMQKDSLLEEEEEAKGSKPSAKEETDQIHHQSPTTPSDESRKTSSEIEEESPVFGSETSTLTDDSPAPEPAKLEEEEEEMHGGRRSDAAAGEKSSSLRSLFAKKKRGDDGDEEKNGGTPRSTTSDSTTFGKSRNSSGAGGSSIFRNLISCGTVDTNDSAVLPMQRRRPVSGSPLLDKDVRTSTEICKPEKVGGSQRIYRTHWNQEQQSKPRKSCDGAYNGGRRSFSGTYKSPNCSQCGKPFNPEKLHAHMMSCKGMKMWAKSTHPVSSAAEKDSEKSTKNSVSAR